ncbi:hypothetical protein X801_01289 [Opisthorchis viverrini]|nr:hypothetical protein X801_01289 [Opisthorchis viverrini]
MDPNSTPNAAFTPEAEHIRPKQGGRRPRGPRQSSNRVLSAGEGEHPDNGKHEGPNGTTPNQLNEHTAVDGHSPNHTVPRQRRRPQRRTPRHRSAPTADTGDNMDDDQNGLEHDAHTPVARYDGRGHPRPFRRPFRQRGGFRYMNGYAYGQNYMVHPVGPPPYQNRFRPMGGYRDGFDQGPRRRGFGGGYPRGPRRRPPTTGDHAPRLNGQIGVDKEQLAASADVVPGESNVPEDAVAVNVTVSAQNLVIQAQVVPDSMNTPQEQPSESTELADMVTTTGDAPREQNPATIERPVTEAAVDPKAELNTANMLQNTADTDAYHPETGSESKDEPEPDPTVEDVIEGVQQIALHDGKLVSTTAAGALDAPVKQEAE